MGDLRGEVSKEIVFVNDAPVDTFKKLTISSELSTDISLWVENLVIDNLNEWSPSYFPFNQFRNLKSLKVGSSCLKNIDKVFLTDMMNLESAVFGVQAFSEYYNAWHERISHENEFIAKNCPNLRQLKFDAHAFSD